VVSVAKALKNVKILNPDDEAAKKQFPLLYDLLCPVWVDGRCQRVPAKLTLRVDSGCYFISLECPTEGLQTTLVVWTLLGLWEELEKALKDNLCNWGATWEKKKRFTPRVDDLIE